MLPLTPQSPSFLVLIPWCLLISPSGAAELIRFPYPPVWAASVWTMEGGACLQWGVVLAELSVRSKLSKAVRNVYKTWILTLSLFCTELFVFFCSLSYCCHLIWVFFVIWSEFSRDCRTRRRYLSKCVLWKPEKGSGWGGLSVFTFQQCCVRLWRREQSWVFLHKGSKCTGRLKIIGKLSLPCCATIISNLCTIIGL